MQLVQTHHVGVLDAATGKEVMQIAGHTDCVRGMAFSPNGQTLATGSEDRTVMLWDVARLLGHKQRE